MSSFSYQYATPRPESQRYSLENNFRSLDVENSGKIKKSILISAAIYTGDQYNRDIIRDQLEKCDDLITYERFKEIFELAQQEEQDKSTQWIFKLYDKDKKGYIDRNDLIRASQITGVPLSEDEITQMLCNNKLLDQNFIETVQSESSVKSVYYKESRQKQKGQYENLVLDDFSQKGVSFEEFSQIMARKML